MNWLSKYLPKIYYFRVLSQALRAYPSHIKCTHSVKKHDWRHVDFCRLVQKCTFSKNASLQRNSVGTSATKSAFLYQTNMFLHDVSLNQAFIARRRIYSK